MSEKNGIGNREEDGGPDCRMQQREKGNLQDYTEVSGMTKVAIEDTAKSCLSRYQNNFSVPMRS